MKTTTKKQKKEPRQLPVFYIYGADQAQYDMVMSSPNTQDLVYKFTLQAIQYGLSENKDTVDIFRLQDGDNVVSIHKSEWPRAIKKAIRFYSKRQEFEKCIDFQQTLNSIENGR